MGALALGDTIRPEPKAAVALIRLSRATYRKVAQSLFRAWGYNLIAIPLVAGVLAPRGLTISPAAGAALMSLSTVIVAINAGLFSLPREKGG